MNLKHSKLFLSPCFDIFTDQTIMFYGQLEGQIPIDAAA